MGCTSCGKKIAAALKLARAEMNIGVLDEAAVKARRAACEACDRWDHGRCGECGCFTFAKSKLPRETCPLDRWPALETR